MRSKLSTRVLVGGNYYSLDIYFAISRESMSHEFLISLMINEAHIFECLSMKTSSTAQNSSTREYSEGLYNREIKTPLIISDLQYSCTDPYDVTPHSVISKLTYTAKEIDSDIICVTKSTTLFFQLCVRHVKSM